MIRIPLRRRAVLRAFAATAATVLTMPRPGHAARAEAGRAAVIEMVDAAAAAIAKDGFPRALSRSDPAIWSRPNARLYVFLMDPSGTLLLHPDKRAEGRNVVNTTDLRGRFFIREIIAACAEHPDGVWTDYVWPSGTTGKLGTKHTYSRRVGDVIVSAGYVAAEV